MGKIIHGMSETKTYHAWEAMKQRCYNSNSNKYYNYGAKGIVVCDQWLHSFPNFLKDMGEAPDGMTLDRINGSMIYSKETCRWADYTTQNQEGRSATKLTADLVRKMRSLHNDGKTWQEIKNMLSLDVSRRTIQRAISGSTWKNVSLGG